MIVKMKNAEWYGKGTWSKEASWETKCRQEGNKSDNTCVSVAALTAPRHKMKLCSSYTHNTNQTAKCNMYI